MSVWDDMQDRGNLETVKKEDTNPETLERMLNKGIVHFVYRKKPKKGQPANSGELREAWGTRGSQTIDDIPHGGPCPPKDVGYSVYFDLEKHGWRVFLSTRLIQIWWKVYSDEEFYEMFPDGNAHPIADLEQIQRDFDLGKI